MGQLVEKEGEGGGDDVPAASTHLRFLRLSRLLTELLGRLTVPLQQDRISLPPIFRTKFEPGVWVTAVRRGLPPTQVTAISARGLPKMDAIGTCDPFVRVELGNERRETPHIAGTYDPDWQAPPIPR